MGRFHPLATATIGLVAAKSTKLGGFPRLAVLPYPMLLR
jgi:hypothetical protein